MEIATPDRPAAEFAPGTPESIIISWLEKHVGGTVVTLERQKRWRPAWFADVRQPGGEIVSLCIRGDRRASPFSDVGDEWRIHELLEAGGVKVPHVYGFIDALPAMVMAKVPGQGFGLLHTKTEADRLAVKRQYAEQLARAHALDIEPLRALGLALPAPGRDTIMAYLDRVRVLYDEFCKQKNFSDPRIDFLVAWANRNVPDRDVQPRFALIDAGQFMSHGGELTAIIDFELSLLGDPMNDLGALRFRSHAEPLGDIEDIYQAYADFAGTPIDYELVRFQTLLFITASTMLSHMLYADYMAMFDRGGNYVEYLTWVQWGYRQAMEVICEIKGYAKPAPPESHPEHSWVMDCLLASAATINQIDSEDEFARYQLQVLGENVAYMKRMAMFGPAAEKAYVADIGDLTGQIPADAIAADSILAAYIATAPIQAEEQLVSVMHRDMSRRCLCLATPNSMHHAGLVGAMAPVGR